VNHILTRYIEAAMALAEYGILPDGEGYLGRIPGCQGVLANADKLSECQTQLREVLEEWILVRLRDGLDIPSVAGINLRVRPIS
jgi:predicted RNase H-like HicB family nuclease